MLSKDVLKFNMLLIVSHSDCSQNNEEQFNGTNLKDLTVNDVSTSNSCKYAVVVTYLCVPNVHTITY